MPVVWTIGHSTRPVAGLIEALAAHGIERVIDVRTVPRSRHNPQFDRDALPAPLEAAGMGYRHVAGLGGLRKPAADSTNTGWREPGFRGYADYMQTPGFGTELDALLELAGRERLALMCAEAVPWRCHRNLLADALTARGVEVRHILSVQEAQLHRLTPFARVRGGRIDYPGLL